MRLRCLLAALLTGAALEAAVVMSPVVTSAGNTYHYDYSVSNTEELPIVGIQLILSVEPSAVSGPAGWISNHTPFDNVFLVQWFFDPTADSPAYIQPGSSITGFLLVAATAPTQLLLTAFNSDLQSITGSTMGPGMVPEPGTLLGGLAAGVMLLVRHMRNRR
jgi:hypothetical protein